MPSKTKRICKNCNINFTILTKHTKNKRGKFCSLSCSAKYYAEKQKTLNVSCAFCNKLFHKKPSKLNSKSGLYFCCREHKHKAQKISAGFYELHPSHYGKNESNYRKLAFSNYPKECNRCDYEKNINVLIVHHIDHNRQNNKLNNLEILCRNCHYEHHFCD
jgi:hypothetical protein